MNPICIGTGLIALDVILNGSPQTIPKVSVGGSCGNVLSILSYLGWTSMPIARLAKNEASSELVTDLKRWNIDLKFLNISKEGSTAIIIHRILKDKKGEPIHKFEFKNPEKKGEWLPNYRPITINLANEIISTGIKPDVFYFDRMNPGTIELAQYFRNSGALIFFEPSSIKDEILLAKCLKIAHVFKFSSDRIPDFKQRFPKISVELEIQTNGSEGLFYRTTKSKNKNNWKKLKSFPTEKIVDAAGAGDWCSAGIIANLANGGYDAFNLKGVREIESALNYGQILGSLNCTLDGARGLMYQYSSSVLKRKVNKFHENKGPVIIRLNSSAQPIIDISKPISISSLY